MKLAIDTGGKQEAQDADDRDRWFTGIMCLLFEPTKQLFNKWLLYGIGTVFSLAVLSVMVTIAMKMLAAVTAAFAVKYLLAMPGVAGAGSTDGINSMALQQGGLGLLLTTMIISAPPMAAAFFQGTLGQFNAYSPFGHIKPEPQGGRGGYGPPNVPTADQSTYGGTSRPSDQSPVFTNQSQVGGGPSSYTPVEDGIKKGGER